MEESQLASLFSVTFPLLSLPAKFLVQSDALASVSKCCLSKKGLVGGSENCRNLFNCLLPNTPFTRLKNQYSSTLSRSCTTCMLNFYANNVQPYPSLKIIAPAQITQFLIMKPVFPYPALKVPSNSKVRSRTRQGWSDFSAQNQMCVLSVTFLTQKPKYARSPCPGPKLMDRANETSHSVPWRTELASNTSFSGTIHDHKYNSH